MAFPTFCVTGLEVVLLLQLNALSLCKIVHRTAKERQRAFDHTLETLHRLNEVHNYYRIIIK